MKSLTKIMILSLSLGIFAQDTYASAKPEKEDAGGCSCWAFMKGFRKARKVLEPMAESALNIAAEATGKTELHDIAKIMDTVNDTVDLTEVALNVNFNATSFEDGMKDLNLKAWAKAATHGLSDVLQVAGEGESKAAELLKKAEEKL